MKKYIIERMREQAGMTEADASKALDAVAEAVTHVANRDGMARVPGLGTFKVKQRAARQGRNPMTGEPVAIAARKVLAFKEAKGG